MMPQVADAAFTGYVFVYGTLRQGDDNDINRLQPAPRPMGLATVCGTMYHLGAYPGVVLGGSNQVVGEVYAISAPLQQVLDEIEEVYPQQRDEYFKRVVRVDVQGNEIPCVVYEINPVYIVGRPAIKSGDWVRDRHRL
jgi:gamma-glutamylcyclotransferase (GGCT)/AIG2-like uncharacterized protein YtfP